MKLDYYKAVEILEKHYQFKYTAKDIAIAYAVGVKAVERILRGQTYPEAFQAYMRVNNPAIYVAWQMKNQHPEKFMGKSLKEIAKGPPPEGVSGKYSFTLPIVIPEPKTKGIPVTFTVNEGSVIHQLLRRVADLEKRVAELDKLTP